MTPEELDEQNLQIQYQHAQILRDQAAMEKQMRSLDRARKPAMLGKYGAPRRQQMQQPDPQAELYAAMAAQAAADQMQEAPRQRVPDSPLGCYNFLFASERKDPNAPRKKSAVEELFGNRWGGLM
jgi:hypothetical protein